MRGKTPALHLSERLRQVVIEKTDEFRRFKQLSDQTGIQANAWKNWFHGRQRPTAEMIESIAKLWPEFAFWVATGISDEEFGHTAPGANGYPHAGKPQSNSCAYFRKALDSYNEALEVNRFFWKEELGDMVNEIEESKFIIGWHLRSLLSPNLLPDEITKKLLELNKELKNAMTLRRSEISLSQDTFKHAGVEKEANRDLLKKQLDEFKKASLETERISKSLD